MGFTWHQTKFKGLRYREHASRRHGVRLDRCYQVRFLLDGQRVEETLGWQSEGWTEEKAALKLGELREAHRTGQGERTLAEKREKASAKRKAEEAARAARERESVTFEQFFEDTYFPQAKADKTPRSWKREEQLARLWIFPVIGNKPLSKVSPMDLERIKKHMADAGRAPRSIQYCLATIRQVFNQARRLDLYSGDNPVSKVKTPSLDNRRLRFLTEDEAQRLLEHLHAVSPQVHDMALLSLHCGLRAGEIFGLTWGDVDLKNELLTLRDTKSGKSRAAYMTAEVRTMFEQLGRGENSDLVFPARGGIKINQISATFDRVVESIGLNNGVTDKRLRVCFHSLRHTYASWLVMRGVDLFTVKEMLGHSSLTMTERYSHLSPHTFRKAAKELEGTLSAKPGGAGKVVALHQK